MDAGDRGSLSAESAEPAESGSAEAVEQDLDAMLDDLKRERDEYLEIAQRAKADFENYRKRSARDAEEAERRGKASLTQNLLPAIDNLERALLAAGVGPPAPDADPAGEPESREVSAHEALAAGVALIHKDIDNALQRAGIEAFDPEGEPFDPSLHEALSTRPAANGEDAGVVAETLARGYRIGETLIRPARVVVTA